jgi:RNA polymerase sigma-70 factor (ECF subfamily)
MQSSQSVADLLKGVRRGDDQAAAELFRRYEAVIRRRVRIWLRMQDPRLRRVFDSMDICQSVLASFFVRAAAGQYDLEEPRQLVSLLCQMARHKLAHQVVKQQAGRRDVRRIEGAADADGFARGGTPSELVVNQELLEEFRKRLTPEELQLAERRGDGVNWATIAADLGGTAEGRRKQLARALDRVCRELKLD